MIADVASAEPAAWRCWRWTCALGEVAGGFVLVKLALVAWMALDPRQVAWIFWLLLVGSSIASHAPKGFRHWPTKKPSP